jgi:hypothetical protein
MRAHPPCSRSLGSATWSWRFPSSSRFAQFLHLPPGIPEALLQSGNVVAKPVNLATQSAHLLVVVSHRPAGSGWPRQPPRRS